MASDYYKAPLSGLNHIDSLINDGPYWNLQGMTGNMLRFTFSVKEGTQESISGQKALSTSQQMYARAAMAYMGSITGIHFIETGNGDFAQIHFGNLAVEDPDVAGYETWEAAYVPTGEGSKTFYDIDSYIYFDTDLASETADMGPDAYGHIVLLHEIGHAMGLKHPFEKVDEFNATVLPTADDNVGNTLMSYTGREGKVDGYGPYDLAALAWIFGDDGLNWGYGGTNKSRLILGTAGRDVLAGTADGDDMIVGLAGNDSIFGGEGQDWVRYDAPRSAFTVSQRANGSLLVSSASSGEDILTSIEWLQFTDGDYSVAQLLDPTLLAAPTLRVSLAPSGYVTSTKVSVSGTAPAGAKVALNAHSGKVVWAMADANGSWSAVVDGLESGQGYRWFAQAQDAAGHLSAWSRDATFDIDTSAPPVPTATVALSVDSNRPAFSGTGDPGNVIHLMRTGENVRIASTTVDVQGKWSIDDRVLPNGDYTVRVDAANYVGNQTSAADTLHFTIANAANRAGTAGNDVLEATASNGAISGGAGVDVVHFGAGPDLYKVRSDAFGYAVTDKTGVYTLYDVERLHFGGDKWLALDIDGTAGQVYRLYQAAFDRTPDKVGLGYWIAAMDAGATLMTVAREFTGQKEFKDLYGSNVSDDQFVTLLYENLLHRAPDTGGARYWTEALAAHTPREDVLVAFSESEENHIQVIDAIENGIAYTPWLA